MDTSSSRRKFLKTIATGVLGGGVMARTAFAEKGNLKDQGGIEVQKGYIVLNETTQKNMMKLAEVLIPGCSGIGMKEKLMNNFRANKGLASYFDAGFWNIDAVSRAKFNTPFYALKDKDKIDKIVKHVSMQNTVFFYNFRRIIVEYYYADPTVWKKLSYNGPPQPRGFMDYAEPPKQPSKKSK